MLFEQVSQYLLDKNWNCTLYKCAFLCAPKDGKARNAPHEGNSSVLPSETVAPWMG